MERGLRLTIAALIAIGAAARLAPLFDQNGRLLAQFPTEAAYLGLTAARNLALGHGLNVSDGTVPASGVQPLATFLWSACFWIVGGAKKTGVLLVLVAELAIGVASAFGLWQLAQRALAGTRQVGLAAPLAAAVWWASPVAIPHAMNGLETGLYAGLVIAVALAFTAPGTEGAWSQTRQLRFGLALGLAFLACSDAVFLSLGACLLHLARPLEGRRRAPLHRATEALLFAAVAAAVAAPWLAFEHLRFGSFAPFAGLAPSGGHDLARVPTAFVELALLLAPIPSWIQDSPPAVAAAWLLCGEGFAAALGAWRRADPTRRALIGLAIFFTLALAGLHGLSLRAGDGMVRCLYPASPFLAIAWGWALVALLALARTRAQRWLAHAALFVAVALALAGDARLYASGAARPQFQAVRWVDAEVPDDAWIGAGQIGALGFYTTAP